MRLGTCARRSTSRDVYGRVIAPEQVEVGAVVVRE